MFIPIYLCQRVWVIKSRKVKNKIKRWILFLYYHLQFFSLLDLQIYWNVQNTGWMEVMKDILTTHVTAADN